MQVFPSHTQENQVLQSSDADNVPIVELSNVKKSFGKHAVLRGLSLKVPRGKITYIIGRSGEGKSVTLKHLVGILKPDDKDSNFGLLMSGKTELPGGEN